MFFALFRRTANTAARWVLLGALLPVTLPVLAETASAPAGQQASAALEPVAEAHTQHATLRLRSERSVVPPGDQFRVALSLTSIPHWHTYWKNPGDTGLPTRISWDLPPGVTAGPIEWPLPRRLPTPPLMSFGYEGSADLLVSLSVAEGLQGILPLRAKVHWLVCAEQCVPESAEVAISLPLGAAAQPSADTAAIAAMVKALPKPAADWEVQASSDGHQLRVDGQVPEGQQAPDRLWLFPDHKGLIVPAAVQPYHHDGRQFALAVALADGASPEATLSGLLLADDGAGRRRGWTFAGDLKSVPTVTVPLDNGAGPAEASTASGGAGVSQGGAAGGLGALLVALGLAFLGGLLLNLMPCVLPVLSIKVFALLGEAGAPRAHLVRQGLLFLLGVLLSFWALAGLLLTLKSAGAAIGWGFQLQSPAFVVALACLFTLLALNFAGLFEVGTGLQARAGTLEQRVGGGAAGDWSSLGAGILTTLVATPCTAPFLGAGIGFTLDRSAAEALLVFTAMGLGVGMPVCLLAAFPGWLRYVPRPGAWMQTLKQAFAFPMLATVVWLAWVLGHQRGVDALAALLAGLTLLALAGWLWGRAQIAALRAPASLGARLQTGLALAALLLGFWCAWPDPAAARPGVATQIPGGADRTQAGAAWEPYSDARLAALRAEGRPVFIDFTAAWCISCQVNKRTSLQDAAVLERLHALGVATLEADWTNADPTITAALARLQRNAVPVYAVYPKSGGEPRLLPEVLTPALVIDALEQAAHR